MKKDIEANLIDKNTNKKNSISPKTVKILIGSGAIVLIVILVIILKSSSGEQNSTEQGGKDSQTDASDSFEWTDESYEYSPVHLNYNNLKASGIIPYLYKYEKKMKLGFNDTTIKYCVPEDTSNSTITTIWDDIQNKTCITGTSTATQSECGLVYSLLNTTVSTDSYIQPRYELDVTDNKIYIYYSNSDSNLQDTLKNLTLKALGVEDKSFRVNNSDSTDAILGSWDSYNLNVLFCPSLAMPSEMPLTEATHIHQPASDILLYFSSTKIAVKSYLYWPKALYYGWVWFYAPWNETIVDVFPSQKDADLMYVHTLTTLYTVDKDYINATAVWKNLPSETNNTIVELKNGNLVLLQTNASSGQIDFYTRSNVEFSQSDYTDSLTGQSDDSRVIAAAYENSVYFMHSGYLYKRSYSDDNTSSTVQVGTEDLTWQVNTTHILSSNIGTDGYLYLLQTTGEFYKLEVATLKYTKHYYTSQNDEFSLRYCGENLASDLAVDYTRYGSIGYLTSAGALCKVNENDYEQIYPDFKLC